jgi:cardiolipin-specific phospholipase
MATAPAWASSFSIFLPSPSGPARAERRCMRSIGLVWGAQRVCRSAFVRSANDVSERVREAESFFVESLEEWRERTGLEKMTLIGHSLGAYLSTVYALRYPQRVHKLILLSPAGVPRGPDTTSPSREVLDRQVTGEDGAVAADSSQVAALEEEQRVEKKKESFRRRLFTHLWEERLESVSSRAF